MWSFDNTRRNLILFHLTCGEPRLGYRPGNPRMVMEDARSAFAGPEWVNAAIKDAEENLGRLSAQKDELEFDLDNEDVYYNQREFISYFEEPYQGLLLVLRPLLGQKPDGEAAKKRAEEIKAEFYSIDPAEIEAMNSLKGNSQKVRLARRQHQDLALRLKRIEEAAREVAKDWWGYQMWEIFESLESPTEVV